MHTDDMDVDGRPASQAWTGLPQTTHSALTPVGEIEQAANIAAGFKQPRHGWRRAVVIIGLGIIALGAVAAIVAGLLNAGHQ
jgi:hypothetical protein